MNKLTLDQINRPYSWYVYGSGQTRKGYCATKEQAQARADEETAKLIKFGTVSVNVGERQKWER